MTQLDDFSIPTEKLRDRIGGGAAFASIDLDAAFSDAVDRPAEFPALHRALVPGDRVTVVVQDELPEIERIVGKLVDYLVEHHVLPADICVLLGPGRAHQRQLVASELKATQAEQVHIEIHQPDLDNNCAYLAATREGQAIMLSRWLCDADVVIPIRDARQAILRQSQGGSELFPDFSTAQIQSEVQSNQGSTQPSIDLAAAARQATDQLGIQFVLDVVPAVGDRVSSIHGGLRQVVREQSTDAARRLWHRDLSEPVDVILADLGHSPTLSWPQLVECLCRLGECVRDEGAIIINSKLPAAPGDAFSLPPSDQDWDSADYENFEEEEPFAADEVSSNPLDRLLERIHVVIVGADEESDWESMGFGVADSTAAVERLLGRYDSCLVVDDALHSSLIVRGEDS